MTDSSPLVPAVTSSASNSETTPSHTAADHRALASSSPSATVVDSTATTTPTIAANNDNPDSTLKSPGIASPDPPVGSCSTIVTDAPPDAAVISSPPEPNPSTSSTDSLPPSTAASNKARRSVIAHRQSSGARTGLVGLAAFARDKTSTTLAHLANKPWTTNHNTHSSTPSHSASRTDAPLPPSPDVQTPNAPNGVEPAAVLPSDTLRTTIQTVKQTTHREIPRSQPGELPEGVVAESKQRRSFPHHASPRSHTPRSHSRASSAANSRSVSPVPGSASPNAYNKMHQTSSRLLRMTEEERPFTRDFKDLFSTLMVSLPLIAHRVRFQKIEHTFTSEEAINNLGSLKFSQSNRMPDPKDPSRIVTTTTTTTFSMAREMARSVCQRFMDGRFIESADGKHATTFPLKNGVWQLTPKGMHVLARFCQRNGITQRHVLDLLDSSRNTMQLVLLERDSSTDRLSHDKATTEVIFRRFVGQDGPNTKQSTSSADSDSLSDYYNGMIGVKMAKERKVFDKTVRNTFTGKAAVDWLMDCSTTVDRKEACETAAQFVQDGLMYPIVDDKSYIERHPIETSFQPTKGAVYALTHKGQRIAGWITRERSSSSDEGEPVVRHPRDTKPPARDSNTNRLAAILGDPALRLLFREFLRDTHCEENLAFYLDVVEFTTSYRNAVAKNRNPRIDTIRETLAAAYGLYNAFLAPGSPCELNIDHNLRNNLASRMTRAVGDDQAMVDSLNEVARLFDEAQNSVFKLMSSDSVPKFLKDPKYHEVLREHDFDTAMAASHYAPAAAPTRAVSKLGR